MIRIPFSKLLALSAFGGIATVAACSDSPAPPVAVDPFVNETAFCIELGKALCNPSVVQACYGSDDKSLAADTAKCSAAVALTSHCHAPGLPYHAAGARGCIDAGAAAYADAKLTSDEIVAYNKACLVAFSRGGPSGSKCTLDSDCDAGGGLRCLLKGDAGTCRVPKTVMNGEDCSGSDSVCNDEYYCDAGSHCVAKQATNKPCDAKIPCDSKSTCNLTSGMCAAKKANGESCSGGGECTGGFCNKAKGSMTGTCVAQLTLAVTSDDGCGIFKP